MGEARRKKLEAEKKKKKDHKDLLVVILIALLIGVIALICVKVFGMSDTARDIEDVVIPEEVSNTEVIIEAPEESETSEMSDIGQMSEKVDGYYVAAKEDGVQIVRTPLVEDKKYCHIQVEAGTPVKWIIDAEENRINACNGEIVIEDYDIDIKIVPGENIIEFTPEEAGTIPYHCGMNMMISDIRVTEAIETSDTGAFSEKVDGYYVATEEDGMQIVRTPFLEEKKYPKLEVKAGVPVKWIITAEEGQIGSCNGEIVINDYDVDVKIVPGENIVEFAPEETGTIPFSCWMDMIRSEIKVVD